MSNKIEIALSGSISLKTENYVVEYDHEGVHARTVFLRLNTSKAHNIPIYANHIDEVIEMLKRGKAAIEALEPKQNE